MKNLGIVVSLLCIIACQRWAMGCDIVLEQKVFGDKKKIDAVVNRTCPKMYQFKNLDKDGNLLNWDLLKLTVTVNIEQEYKELVYKYPIAVTVNAKGSSLSFSLPSGYKENSIIRREMYLCPNSTTEPPVGRRHKNKQKKPRSLRDVEGSDQILNLWDGNMTDHVIKTRSADKEEENPDNLAIVSISTVSSKSVRAEVGLEAKSFTNFRVWTDEQAANATSKSNDPWIRLVEIPENVDAVQVKVMGDSDMCAALAVQPFGKCPFISTEEDIKLAFRRLTFTRQGTMVIKRSEMSRFFVIVFTLSNDKACGNDVYDPGRSGKAKWAAVEVRSISEASNSILPISITLAFFALFYMAIAPIKIVKSLMGGKKMEHNPVPLSIRSDDDALMEASVSRSASPRPIDAHTSNTEPMTGNLIAIDSANVSVIGSDVEATVSQVPLVATLDPIQENFFGESSSAEHQNSQNVETPFVARNVQFDAEGLRQRLSPTVRSDISCVLKREIGQMVPKQESFSNTRWYAWIQTILCGFLLLIVIQQVSWFYPELVDDGNLDVCYYNGRCGTPLGPINSFNHMFSNIGYILLGSLALMILKRRYSEHEEEKRKGQAVHSMGLPTHFGMMAALGLGMVFQGLFSAVYHQCPNSSSIQFESINIYLIAMLALFKLYGSRHDPTQPHVAYGVALAIWALVTVSTMGSHPALWWIPFLIMEIMLMPFLSLQIYYHGHVRYSTDSIKSAYLSFKNVVWTEIQNRNWQPLFKHRLTALAIGNGLNIMASCLMAALGTVTLSEYILSGLIVNFILYFIYYLGNKIACKERIAKLTWFYLVAALLFWGPALKYFFTGTMDWKLTAAQSRALNRDCSFFNFYDSHDAWHILSSVALFFSFMSLLTLDDELKGRRRNEIAIF